MVYAALLFEYVDPAKAMPALRRLCDRQGTLIGVFFAPA